MFFLNNKKEEKPRIVEISFGTGNSRGGSGPKAFNKDNQKEKSLALTPPKILRSLKSLTQSAPSAPSIIDKAQTDNVSRTDSSSNKNPPGTGNGIGTGGEGTGTGYTSGSGAGLNDSMTKYRGIIHQLVNSKKIYPKKAKRLRQEGHVVIKVKLSRDGQLLDLEVITKSKFESLTTASIEAIRNVTKFPDIPIEAGLDEVSFNIPFDYQTIDGDFI